jgi:hypothetical protein
MKAKTWSTVGGVMIILWVLTLLSGNVTFYPPTSGETLGYDVGNLILPILGILALLKGNKQEKTEKKIE